MPPKTIGPVLATSNLEERAELARVSDIAAKLTRNRQAAKRLARTILGAQEIEFDDFYDPEWAQKAGLEPQHCVTFSVDGLEFTYREPFKHRDESYDEQLYLVYRCDSCGVGVCLEAGFVSLARLGRALKNPSRESVCVLCRSEDTE